MSTTLTESEDPEFCVGKIAVRRIGLPNHRIGFQFITEDGPIVIEDTEIRTRCENANE